MKGWSVGFLLSALVAALPNVSQAQVHKGDVRLFLDMGLVSWRQSRVTGDVAPGDYLEKDTYLGAGPGAALLGTAGVGIGVAATRHIIPTLYFSLQQVKYKGRTEINDRTVSRSENTLRQFELRPQVEFTLMPESRFVPHADLGLSLFRRVADPGDSSSLGVGPVLGLGAHGFITSRATLDIGLAFRFAFVKDDDNKDRIEMMKGVDDVKQRELAMFFTVGASFWL